MKKVLFVLLCGLALMGCNQQTEKSETLKEQATVVSLIYSPSRHDVGLGTTMMNDYSNPAIGGIDMNGKQGIKVGNGLQVNISHIPERFGAVFQCQHGTFTIQGDGSKDDDNTVTKYKTLYDKMQGHVGDTVNILYQEVYTVTYEKNKDGVRVPVKKELNKLDFIDAQLVK